MNTCFKVFASYNILQYLWFYPCYYICNCLKMPEESQINDFSDTHNEQVMFKNFHTDLEENWMKKQSCIFISLR